MEEKIFQKFIEDMLPRINIKTLPKEKYKKLIEAKINQNLDFDDAYQYSVAKTNDLTIVTLDQDFKNIQDIDIQLL